MQVKMEHVKHNQTRPVAAVVECASSEPKELNDLNATMMGHAHPVVYITSNASTVIEGNSREFDTSNGSVVSESVLSMTLTMHVASVTLPPFCEPHLFWNTVINNDLHDYPVSVQTLIDHSSHIVLIRKDTVQNLSLPCHCLPKPEKIKLAMSAGSDKQEIELKGWVKLQLHDPIFLFNMYCSSYHVKRPWLPSPSSPL
jgi:hypothetical protein